MPESWSTVALADVAAIALSGVDKHIVPGETSVRLCNYLDVYRNRRLTLKTTFAEGSATATEIRRLKLRKGDVIITKDSETPVDIGVPSLVEDELNDVVCGYHLALLRPEKEKLGSGFLLHYLQGDATKRHFLRTANGLTRFGLGSKAVASLPIALPPPDEQAAVARILDAVDTALKRTRAAVERARELRMFLIHEMLGRGTGREAQRKSAAGLIPIGWTCDTLGKYLSDGPTNGVYRPESDYAPHGTRIIRIDDFEDGHVKSIEDLRRVVVEPAIQARYAVTEDDVVINRVNSLSHIGKAALMPSLGEPTIFESNMMRVRCDPGLRPAFLNLVLCSDIARRHWLARAKPAVNQASVNQRDARELPLPIPPTMDEQDEIVSIVSAAQRQIDLLADVGAVQQRLKKSLMHDLLTGRVRVRDASKVAAS